MHKLIQVRTFILFFLLLTPLLHSQSGKIAGVVKDATTNEAIPFVNILIEETTMGSASNIDGEYFILNVPPGVYSIKASAIGYNAVTVQNIKVQTGFTTNLDFKLNTTAIELKEDVVVIATRPLVQKDLTASTATVGADLISELPVTEISDVLQLQAGIVSSGGDLHVRGGRKGQIAFQIDGVPVTDAYDGGSVIEVSATAVQELQVISGAFNAEYGQAMSGIVNLVTKDGNNNLNGSISAYSGGYASNKSDKFWGIEKLNPFSIRSIEGSLSGPIIKDNLFFFTTGRYFYNTGYFFGRRTFLVTDRATEVPGSGGTRFNITQNGDNELVAMNPNERIYGQAKLTYRVFPGMKVSYNYILERQEYQDFNSDNRLTPDNNLQRFRRGYTNQLSINHAVSNASYYNLNFSYYFKNYRHFLFEDIYTGNPTKPTNYVDNYVLQTPPYSFNIGGTDYSRFYRSSGTISAKLDWATQFTQEINVQFGGEYKRHQIYYENINLFPLYENGILTMGIPPSTSNNNDQYLRKPTEYAGYIQSKFEAFNLIFNIGLRMDIFDPNGVVLTDPTDPYIYDPRKPSNRFHDNNGNGVQDIGEPTKTLEERLTYWYKDASIKYQLSPRIGLAFPITDAGVIHFSYGHFLQLPPYELMYANPDFEIGVGSGNQGVFGNADLKPQKTVKGEIGLQQQIGEDIAVDFTVFFEDFRDLTGTQTDEILVFGRGSSYSKYSNTDFGYSKGFIVKFQKRFSDGLATSLDYTYSVTKGNASNPADARNAIASGALPETFIAPLDWDQTHTLNLSIAYSKPRDYSLSLIGNYYSGQPYTPGVNKNTNVTQNAFPRNSQIKPNIFNVDLRVSKDFDIGIGFLSVFLKVFNLLDSDNPRGLYSDSGDPIFTFGRLEAEKINPTMYYNTLDQRFMNPGFFSEPRRVELGLSYNF
ncbi:MAG: TonB-dependent receptor [Ignavibacteriaceae bacterium]|nr:TonB-dependent receptor [Ignavibacteriaceae bacterium]